MTHKFPVLLTIALFTSILFLQQSCQKESRISPDNTSLDIEKLSDYQIYEGDPANLVPTKDFQLYEISSQLFSDYAHKQRLIKVPENATIKALHNGLPEFPEGTILAKTFFYYNDERDPSFGKKLIETRVLVRREGKWVAGTYYWNDDQTDAYLTNVGFDRLVNWIDGKGNAQVVSYHIPSNLECRACHSTNRQIQAIGPKVRNLNFTVNRDGNAINQLDFLINKGILQPVEFGSFASTPDYNDQDISLDHRARAYLDINCAHCHSHEGSAQHIRYRFEYETAFPLTKLKEGKNAIKAMMEGGYMPKIGTTVKHSEGIDLIRQYLKTL